MTRRLYKSDAGVVQTLHSADGTSGSTHLTQVIRRNTSGTNQGIGIGFNGYNTDDADKEYAYCGGRVATETAGAEDGTFEVFVTVAGTVRQLKFRVTGTAVDLQNSIALKMSSVEVFTSSRHWKPRLYANTSLPSAVSGETIAVSNTGILGSLLRSNGTDWLSDGVYRSQMSSNTTIAVPAGWAIDSIFIAETAGNDVTGGIKIGTTAGGTDIVSSFAVAANSIGHIPAASFAKRVFSRSSSQNVTFTAITSWNSAVLEVATVLKKVY